jgi:hypothetical protein
MLRIGFSAFKVVTRRFVRFCQKNLAPKNKNGHSRQHTDWKMRCVCIRRNLGKPVAQEIYAFQGRDCDALSIRMIPMLLYRRHFIRAF